MRIRLESLIGMRAWEDLLEGGLVGAEDDSLFFLFLLSFFFSVLLFFLFFLFFSFLSFPSFLFSLFFFSFFFFSFFSLFLFIHFAGPSSTSARLSLVHSSKENDLICCWHHGKTF